ncbi:MAG: tRNA (adenosine(37)-N6)-threonylcarbamoyltransferase complex ATPase subunit type 1 TsaE [Leeuwenhoekiella sp.]
MSLELEYKLQDIDHVAKSIIENSTSKTILFYGEMGTGKTTLIRSIVKQLGSQEAATSPTFSIVNEYADKNENPIYHFDFYRISDEKEALDLGLMDYLASENWIFIEWPEKINISLFQKVHTAKITSVNDKTRNLVFQ